MNEKIPGYEYVSRTLKGYGVSHVFYIEAILRMAIRDMQENGIAAIMAHSENAAGYMADGYARISRKPGVCMAQSIGAANLAGGICDAWLANSPVIAITGKKTPPFQYRNCYQEADHRSLYDSLTKFNADIVLPEQLPLLLRQAFREAVTGKPRPVHLDVNNQMGRTLEVATINEPVYIEEAYSKYPAFRPAAPSEKVALAADAINEAEKPVIVAGRGAWISDAGSEIYQLAVKGDIPVVTSPDGKTLIDESDSLWAGIVGNYGMDCANKSVMNADLVIFIGTQTADQTTYDWRAPKQSVKVVQIDVEASELGKNYPNAVGLLGDARVVAGQLFDAIDKKQRPEWRKQVSGYVKATQEEYDKQLYSDCVPVRPERLCLELNRVLPENAVIVADTGYSAEWTATMLRLKPTQDYLRAAGSLGWAFPAGLGVKCAVPERPVICFAGDGAFYYHLGEMETAMRYGIATVTVINNNQVLGQCATDLNQVHKNKEIGGAGHYSFTDVNLSKIAEQIGCYAVRVDKTEDIGPAIEKAINVNKPAVVEVMTDKNANVPPPYIPDVR